VGAWPEGRSGAVLLGGKVSENMNIIEEEI